jgi:hypothetical protein
VRVAPAGRPYVGTSLGRRAGARELWVSGTARAGRRVARAALLVAVAVLATGCRLGVTAGADIDVDGSATVEVALRIDGSMRVELGRLAVDPILDLDAALADDTTWRREVTEDADGGLVLRFVRRVPDPEALEEALRELSAGLAADDPALVVDLDVEVARDGAVDLRGTAGVRPPAFAGAIVDGRPIGPSGDDLAALAARVVEARLVVTLPGPVEDADADRIEGRTLTWELPVGSVRPVRAVGGPAPLVARVPWVPVGVGAGFLVALVLVRRRGSTGAGRQDGGRVGGPALDEPRGPSEPRGVS